MVGSFISFNRLAPQRGDASRLQLLSGFDLSQPAHCRRGPCSPLRPSPHLPDGFPIAGVAAWAVL